MRKFLPSRPIVALSQIGSSSVACCLQSSSSSGQRPTIARIGTSECSSLSRRLFAPLPRSLSMRQFYNADVSRPPPFGSSVTMLSLSQLRFATTLSSVDIELPSDSSKEEEMRLKSGDWICSKCEMHNFSRRRVCFRCASPRKMGGGGGGGGGRSYPLDWKCKFCDGENFEKRRECFFCGKPRKSLGGAKRADTDSEDTLERRGKPSERIRPGDWLCPSCNMNNFAARSRCFSCSEPRPSSTLKEGDWLCPHCGQHNFRAREKCFSCSEPNPSSSEAQVGEPGLNDPLGQFLNTPKISDKKDVLAGDWTCPKCGFSCFRRREICPNCQTPKPPSEGGAEISEVAAKLPNLPNRPGDWTCASCKSHNFAWRTVCLGCKRMREDAD